MSNLTISRLSPRLDLKPFIKDIWIFESNGMLSEDEMRTIAPNGSLKLMMHYEGHLAGRIDGHSFPVPEHRLIVAGVSDCPVIADFDRGKPFGCICFELNPAAAYRLLTVPQHELRNVILPFGDIIDTSAIRILEEQMYVASDPVHKAVLFQDYLSGALTRTQRDTTFEQGVFAIINASGRISMASLSQQTGRSDRWLRAKFAERLGISPKTFASIVRFQSCYRALLQDKHSFLQGGAFIDHYYDQAHFIKEFKRFMGYPPTKYTSLHNEVGEIIYF